MWRHGDESTNDSDGHHFLRHAKELIYDSSASSYRSRSDQSGRRDDQFFYFGYDARWDLHRGIRSPHSRRSRHHRPRDHPNPQKGPERFSFGSGGRRLGNHMMFRLVIVSVIMALFTLNFYNLPTTEEPKIVPSIIEMSTDEFLIGAPDEQENSFLKNGKAKATDKLVTFDLGGENNDSDRAQDRYKRNRILYGSKSKGRVNGWPLLTELIDSSGNISIGKDVSGFLDFSIVGFPKTGTTTLLRHLSKVTDALPAEHCGLVTNNTATLLKDIYNDRARLLETLKNGEEMKERLLGLKCPQDISSDWSMHNYAKYFPRTKLIIGVRHPVLWFESFYNFRVSNVPWKKMLHTSKLTKGCIGGSQGVCAWRANFHDFLSRLGKTPMTTSSERELLVLGLDPVLTPVGPVFLYELSQLTESDDGGIRSEQFRKDLGNFLELSTEIPPFPKLDTSGRFDSVPGIKRLTDESKIHICDTEHDDIREVLMEKAKMSSVWIREYFLHSDEVVISSRNHFIDIIERWMYDPCTKV
mmetsp:Transcript_10795/g.22090  ORF Transcript_10795/g.22090 Transcript_10795/m.22090 type:complete len:526 (+) Transcript_10795:35-1612(+)